MTESFLRKEDIILEEEQDIADIANQEDYIVDFGLNSRNGTGQYIDIKRIIVKSTITEKPYSNKHLASITGDLFGIEKTVIEKSEYVRILRSEKNIALIERDNHLQRLQKQSVQKETEQQEGSQEQEID